MCPGRPCESADYLSALSPTPVALRAFRLSACPLDMSQLSRSIQHHSPSPTRLTVSERPDLSQQLVASDLRTYITAASARGGSLPWAGGCQSPPVVAASPILFRSQLFCQRLLQTVCPTAICRGAHSPVCVVSGGQGKRVDGSDAPERTSALPL
jgi:hypothetical protein